MATKQTLAAATRAYPVTIYSDDVPIPYPNPSLNGITTGGGADFLTDTTVNFFNLGIRAGDIIHNTSTGEADIVSGVSTATRLQTAGFSTGFLPADSYIIYPGGQNQGCTLYVGQPGILEVETVGGDIVNFISFAVTEGQILPVQVLKVRKLSTDLSIIALW